MVKEEYSLQTCDHFMFDPYRCVVFALGNLPNTRLVCLFNFRESNVQRHRKTRDWRYIA
jgi:hypothetical protein